MGKAYSETLASESMGMRDKWDPEAQVYNGVTYDDLERFARIVAYKVAHNLKNGHKMDPDMDPLEYVDCSSWSKDDPGVVAVREEKEDG